MNLFNKIEGFKYILDYSDPYANTALTKNLNQIINNYNFEHWIIVCIGTDRSTGDSLGPLVGSKLKKFENNSFTVLGTLEEPIHALNINETIEIISTKYNDSGIIAIDASLGRINSVGNIQIIDGPLKPGAGVKKDLPSIGHFHITGIVNVGGFMEYFVLQNTRLSVVIRMSELIALSIINNFGSKSKKENVINK